MAYTDDSTDGKHGEVHRKRAWMKNARIIDAMKERYLEAGWKAPSYDFLTNAWECRPVDTSKFAKNSAGLQVNPHKKPLRLIRDIINVHMRGPEKLDLPSCPLVQPAVEEFHWILDACCGSGTTSVAANSLGFGSVAFDR